MREPSRPSRLFLAGLLVLAFCSWGSALVAVDLTAVGKIESVFQGRVTMSVIEVLGEASASAPIGKGDLVSFDIPKDQVKNRRTRNLKFGNIVETELQGNVATEYEDVEESVDTTAAAGETPKKVLLWTATRVERVKNARKWDPSKKKGRNKRKKKEKTPPKVWTQEETVRAKVYERKDRVYLKESRLGGRDKGLEILDGLWKEKLLGLKNQKVVVHGITHRTSAASGTMDIQNILKIYPK